MDSWHGRLGVRFRATVTIIFSAILSHSTLWTIFTDRIPLFLWTRTEKWPVSWSKFFLQKEKHVQHLTRILSYCLLINMRCRWTSTWRWSFVWNSLVFHFISTVTLELLDWAATYWILGRYSTRIPLAHHQFRPRFLYSGVFLNHSNLCSHAVFDWVILVYLTKTQYRIPEKT